LIDEHNKIHGLPSIQSPFQLTLRQDYYFNSNLPNLENQNGLYFHKGSGFISGMLYELLWKNILFTVEPRILQSNKYNQNLPTKEKIFSVLNDIPINQNFNNFRNVGLSYTYRGLAIGFGNWDQWWGPRIHNSLVLSNNSEGFYHYFIGTDGFRKVRSDLMYQFKYFTSNALRNSNGVDYYLSSWFLNIKLKNIEFGTTRNIISGGNNDIEWNISDAAKVLFSNDKIKYWDQIYGNYILYNSLSGLKIFFEWGYPNRSFSDEFYTQNDHAKGSNLGIRKHGAFGYNEIVFGFEYTRLVQSAYYNLHPSPNWYDNIKYNYNSIKGRRWAAHSGSDSDDFLVFFGYINDKSSFIYGINYERHGVTFRFPPEVKFESKVSASYNYKNFKLFINYENEYFEHYGFVDSNKNVWEESFEKGSIQRTQTIFITIEHSLSF